MWISIGFIWSVAELDTKTRLAESDIVERVLQCFLSTDSWLARTYPQSSM